MKLIVLNWLKDASVNFLGRAIEILFRIILLILPMGLFLVLIQYREKASKVSNITVYTNDESTWQHIFPGFILVAVNPKLLNNTLNNMRKNFQAWVFKNQYLLSFMFMATIVLLMVWGYVQK